TRNGYCLDVNIDDVTPSPAFAGSMGFRLFAKDPIDPNAPPTVEVPIPTGGTYLTAPNTYGPVGRLPAQQPTSTTLAPATTSTAWSPTRSPAIATLSSNGTTRSVAMVRIRSSPCRTSRSSTSPCRRSATAWSAPRPKSALLAGT